MPSPVAQATQRHGRSRLVSRFGHGHSRSVGEDFDGAEHAAERGTPEVRLEGGPVGPLRHDAEDVACGHVLVNVGGERAAFPLCRRSPLEQGLNQATCASIRAVTRINLALPSSFECHSAPMSNRRCPALAQTRGQSEASQVKSVNGMAKRFLCS
jgi:hypothetical protein